MTTYNMIDTDIATVTLPLPPAPEPAKKSKRDGRRLPAGEPTVAEIKAEIKTLLASKSRAERKDLGATGWYKLKKADLIPLLASLKAH